METKYTCAQCQKEFDETESQSQWLAHALFCKSCMERFVAAGWVEKDQVYGGRPRMWQLTVKGMKALPEHRTVAYCPQDGMPIYQRWISSGVASIDAYPYCLGKKPPFG